jgi:hypothetical protein
MNNRKQDLGVSKLVLYPKESTKLRVKLRVPNRPDVHVLSSTAMCNLLRRHRRSLDASRLRVGIPVVER